MIKMARKKNKNKTRSHDLQAVEIEILEIFKEKNLTISEALFIFEKIKFSAFIGLKAEGKFKQAQVKSTMYR